MLKVAIIAIVFSMLAESKLFAQAGALDSTFGMDGIVLTPMSNPSTASAAALQPDGKIVIVGFADTPGPLDYAWALARYNHDGSLDNTFGGSDGIILFDVGFSATSLAIQNDGKLIVAGIVYDVTHLYSMLRLNPDGSLDSGFADKGILLDTTALFSVAIQSDGKIVAAGSSSNGIKSEFAISRFNENGTLDSTFGSDGLVTTSINNGNAGAVTQLIQLDGKIIVGGILFETIYGGDFALARYLNDGTLDTSFGNGGVVTTSLGSDVDYLTSIALQPDSKIVAAGSTLVDFSDDFALVRYKSDGSLDSTFDGDGIAKTKVSLFHDRSYPVVVESDGKIISGGVSTTGGDQDFTLVRYNQNGSIDSTFGDNGNVITSFGISDDFIRTVCIQQDGKIVAAGNSGNTFALARYLSGLNVGVIDPAIEEGLPIVYPNPIEKKTLLEYSLLQDEVISIELYDLAGKLVQSLAHDELRKKGENRELLCLNRSISSGSYILRIGSQKFGRGIRIIIR